MNNAKTLVIIILVFTLLVGGASILYTQLGDSLAPEQLATQPPQQNEDPGTDDAPQKAKAPDFTVYDAAGKEVRLSDYVGKPIVLNFWASWCGPCRSEMPDFQDKYAQLGEDVQFLMINMTDGSRETVESASAFISQNGFAFPVFYDTASEAASAYGIYSLPTTLFIDAEGHIIAQATGAIDAETLQKGIDMIS